MSVSGKEPGTLKMSFNIQINQYSVWKDGLFVSVVYLTSPGNAGRRPEGERSPPTDWTTSSPLYKDNEVKGNKQNHKHVHVS